MAYKIGEILRIENEQYQIIGYIDFQSTNENSHWTEYRILNTARGQEWWLSADDYNNEYSLSRVADSGFGISQPDTTGYHMVDMGTAVVTGYGGDVDVDRGEIVNYTEYEDLSEDNIISVEVWEDETEHSRGRYVDTHDIESVGAVKVTRKVSGGKQNSGIIALTFIAIFFAPMIIQFAASMIPKQAISKYLKNSSYYTYSTSITSSTNEKEKADVYKTFLSMDEAAKDIIDAIDGETEDVQQNKEDSDDNSIAILTKREYCLVYADAETGGTLVQISSRLYTYTSDSQPYHSRTHTHRFYRRHYYSRAYTYDSDKYSKKYSNSYGSYSDSTIPVDASDSYRTYSNSVRQASVAARSSSGGGTSSGK